MDMIDLADKREELAGSLSHGQKSGWKSACCWDRSHNYC